ncbi:hypothetical protein MNEG_16411 [Monoraphidium neglectum]|uniref:Protein-serine/threonine phosphatase n=1 Tax=Monoraphidium neglectum TaxID=145388 RepID=A0A0D2K5V8_9CHLO|nr:hypothetical protein MNEG_16411 [Monoraphidium neglectum]KIY91553.1 hypothetical protein MNEG_16411 [Monoraphidium neglectum]|eukprot:XP_013890573.1 hypothetical protein MNEG_16411 [Monoraphidium neglectum]
MTNQEAVDFLRARLAQGASPTESASQLLDACLASDPKESRGVGCDNMTAIVVRLQRGGGGGGEGPGAGGEGAESGGGGGAAGAGKGEKAAQGSGEAASSGV